MILVLAAALAPACVPDSGTVVNVEPEARTIGLLPVSFKGSDGFLVTLYSNVEFKVSVPSDTWLRYYGAELTSRSSNLWSLIFAADPNDSTDERSVDITIKDKETQETILSFALTQEAGEEPYFLLGKTDTEMDAGEGTLKVSLRTNVFYETSIEGDWLTLDEKTTTSSELHFKAEANETVTNRTAVVTFTRRNLGTVMGTITVVQKGRPANDVQLVRAWGKYRSSDSEWFTTLGIAGNNLDRSIALDGNYIYIPKVTGGESGGIAVVDYEGNYVKSLGTGDGISTDNSTWPVSDVKVLPNADGSVLLACNMSRQANSCKIRIYAWENISAAPKTVVYDFSSQSESRYGDKMSVSGTWQNGEIRFVDYFAGSAGRRTLVFKITDGVISATPVATALTPIPNACSAASELNCLFESSYLYCGGYTGDNQTEYFSAVYTRSDDSFEKDFNLSPSKGFDRVMHGAQVFQMNEKYHLIWETFDDASADRTAFVKVLQLSGDDPVEAIRALDTNELSAAKVYPLADAESLAFKAAGANGNRSGSLAVREKDGKWYVAALGTGSGISLFEVKGL